LEWFSKTSLDAKRSSLLVLNRALLFESEFWRVKSKASWHLHGDRNTMYLHEVAKIRNTSKQILYLRNGDAILTEQEAIQTHFLHYYHNLFNGNTPSFNFNLISKTISHLVNDANNVVLTHLATFKEVELVFNLSPSSAPGPDCFEGISIKLTSLSFLRTCLMMHFQFFKENSMTSNFNSSFLILIPKGDGAEYVGNCRPVLSNFKFKIITKMLAYKISVISDIHISPHQKRLSLRQEHLRLYWSCF